VASTTPYPDVDRAVAYARMVLGKDIPACHYVHLACERFLQDLEDAFAERGPWYFNSVAAQNAMTFAGKMVNIKGPEAGKPLRLMDWQCFVFANLFGFMERGTTTRRYRQGIIYVPRGNGKTSIAAPLALYLTFMDGEGGAEGYAAAVTRDQARILFDTAREMARRSPDLKSRQQVQIGANALYSTASASKFVPVSSDAKALHGLNVAIAVCDEIGSHKTSEVYDVLLTAMGKRKHPMLVCISTATGNNSGIGKQLWDYGVRVLEGKWTDDQLFCLIYTARTDELGFWYA
jgi:phage terminase large subunit-like protein